MQPIPGYKTVYNILKAGSGATVQKGNTVQLLLNPIIVHPYPQVTVHATGSVQETGKKFWSTKDAGKGRRVG